MCANEKKRKRKARIILLSVTILVILIHLSLLSCCTYLVFFSNYNYETNGIGNYKYWGDYSSPFEIDYFGEMLPYRDNFACIDCGYYYRYHEKGIHSCILDRGFYFFVYTEEDYPAAKAYCFENCFEIGTEPTEEYSGSLFYDFYGSRGKEEFYHGDDYPKAFKCVFFNDEKHVIGFLGIYTSDKYEKELAETLCDWGVFLNTYYAEWYSFD